MILGPPRRLRLAALRFGARRSARPCGGFAAWVWPFGPPRRIARPFWPAAKAAPPPQTYYSLDQKGTSENLASPFLYTPKPGLIQIK